VKVCVCLFACISVRVVKGAPAFIRMNVVRSSVYVYVCLLPCKQKNKKS
jgi:hypothetical protein